MLALALLVFSLRVPACERAGLLPDAACSPGAIATADVAIVCHTSARSRRHVTAETRRIVLAEYGVAEDDAHLYEVDHLVPLELGGSNSVENLWPEPLADARRKDVVENRAHAAVCAGRVRLVDAQALFLTDWTKGISR